MTFACLYSNGIQVPSKPFTPDFANHCCSREYMSLFSGTGRHFTDSGLDISLDDYVSGNCLIAVDLTGDLSDCGAYHMIDKGTIRLELKFSIPLASSVNVVVLAEWDSCLRISKDRAVFQDFHQ